MSRKVLARCGPLLCPAAGAVSRRFGAAQQFRLVLPSPVVLGCAQRLVLQPCYTGVSAGERRQAMFPPCRGTADGGGTGGGQSCSFSCKTSRAAQLLNWLLQAKAGMGAGRTSLCPDQGCSCALQNSAPIEQISSGIAEPVLQGRYGAMLVCCNKLLFTRELTMVCGPCGCCLQGAVPGSAPENCVATNVAPCKLPLGSQPCPTPPSKTVIPGIFSFS